MNTENENSVTREEMASLLNEDLAREYQAIISYVIYSQTLKGAQYNHIAKELESHAAEELAHAIEIARQIDYLNGSPTSVPIAAKVSPDAEEMLRFDLENERVTIQNYRRRIRQADAMGEFGARRSAPKDHRTGAGSSSGSRGCLGNRNSENRVICLVCRPAGC